MAELIQGFGSEVLGAHTGHGAVILPWGIERGAHAGIEPATGAWMTRQIGSAGAGQIMSTQLHHSRMCRPAGGLPNRQNLSLAMGEGDVRIK